MTSTTKIYLVRHGESEANSKHLLGGQMDFALTLKGKEQAKQAAELLRNINFDEVYASDLQRAYHTAEIIAGVEVPESHRIIGLRERTYGELDGKAADNLTESEKEKATLSEEGKWYFRNVPGMETDQEMYDRFISALEKIVLNNKGKTILVTAHGGPIRSLMMKFKGYTHDNLPRGAFKNADFLEIDHSVSGGFKVLNK